MKIIIEVNPVPEMGETTENVRELIEEGLDDSGICDARVHSVLPEEFEKIGLAIKTDDFQGTNTHIFVVTETQKIWGMDSDYSEDYEFKEIDSGKYLSADDEQNEALENLSKNYETLRLEDEDGDVSHWDKFYYIEKDFIVQFFFSQAAAEEFIEKNKHRHSGKLGWEVDWLGRNQEMKLVREFLLSLSPS